jgi:hypothetical protein
LTYSKKCAKTDTNMTPFRPFVHKLFTLFSLLLVVSSQLIGFLPVSAVVTAAQTQPCPAGQEYITGLNSCIPICSPPQYYSVPALSCVSCPENQTPVNGTCMLLACPNNLTMYQGRCVEPCPVGQNRDTGKCACVQGTKLVNGECKPVFSLSGCSPINNERADICHLIGCDNGTNNYPACTNCPDVRAEANLGLSVNTCPLPIVLQPVATQPVVNTLDSVVKPTTNTIKANNEQSLDADQKEKAGIADQKAFVTTNSTTPNAAIKDNQVSQSTNEATEVQKPAVKSNKSSNPYILPVGIGVTVVVSGLACFLGFRFWKLRVVDRY